MGIQYHKTTVVLVDDHPLARQGVRTILNAAPDIQVIGEGSNGQEAQHLVSELRPDILLLDIEMPGGLSGLDVEHWVRKHYPETITLVLTAHDRAAYLAEMAESGAKGFLLKDTQSHRIVLAIRQAIQGICLLSEKQLHRAEVWREQIGARWRDLSSREREVLELLLDGQSNDAIATTLGIAMRTVECHVTQILHKLDVDSRLEAVAWVHKHIPKMLRECPH